MSNPINAPRWRTWLGAASLLAAQLLNSAVHARTSELAAITSYTIQLQNVGRDIDKLASSDHDLLIIEPTINDGASVARALSRTDVARLQTKPDGSRRIVLAYLSVGEAEEYRDYWQSSWSKRTPNWIIGENPSWKGNHIVRFWDVRWKRILVSDRNSMLNRIITAGFDGVSLDRVDVAEELEHVRTDARAKMIELVADIAATARKARPDFVVLAHNPEALLADARFRNVVDGVLKEDLLYGSSAAERRNSSQTIAWSHELLGILSAEGKPVLVAEYISDQSRADDTVLELLDRNFLPGIFSRALDGSTPWLSAATEHNTRGTNGTVASHVEATWASVQ